MADSGIASDTSFKVGQRIKHAVYGLGTVIAVENSPKLGDGPGGWKYEGTFQPNGWSRYKGHLNLSIKFDNGGPQGFATNASNDVSEIQEA